MKKLLILLALIPFTLGGQTPTTLPYIDLSKYHDGVRLWEMTDSNFVSLNKIFNIGDSTISNLEYIDFSLEDGWSQQEGRIGWNDDDKTIEAGLDGGSVLQMGQEVHLRATNKTGDTIENGSVVYVSGVQGSRPTIAKANNNSVATSLTAFGMTTQNILNNATGYVTLTGLVRNLNTSAFSEGDLVWLDSIDGGLTATRPNAPWAEVAVGIVSVSNANEGIIIVHPVLGQRLAWLPDVNARGNQANNHMLVWNSDSLLWESRDSIATGAMYYTDTYWDDLKAPFSSTRRGALSKPDFDYDNVGLLFPQNDTSEIVYAVMQFSHSRKASTDISPHIHWQQMNGNDVVWMMQYKWFDNGSVPPTAWTQLTESADVFTYTSGNLLQITEFPMIDGSGITGVSSIFLVKVWRDDNVDGGAGSGDALGWEFDLHYQKDQPASANEYSK